MPSGSCSKCFVCPRARCHYSAGSAGGRAGRRQTWRRAGRRWGWLQSRRSAMPFAAGKQQERYRARWCCLGSAQRQWLGSQSPQAVADWTGGCCTAVPGGASCATRLCCCPSSPVSVAPDQRYGGCWLLQRGVAAAAAGVRSMSEVQPPRMSPHPTGSALPPALLGTRASGTQSCCSACDQPQLFCIAPAHLFCVLPRWRRSDLPWSTQCQHPSTPSFPLQLRVLLSPGRREKSAGGGGVASCEAGEGGP